MTVLIVEPNDKDYQHFYHLVNWASLDVDQVVRCCDGISAFETILHTWPDTVFLDIRLPGIDGIELIRRVKEHGLACEFIITSRYHRFEYAQSVMRMGVEEYLVKPVDQRELVRVMENQVRLSRLQGRREMNERFWKTRQLLRNSFMDAFTAADTAAEADPEFSIETLNQKYHFSLKEGIFQSTIISLDGLPVDEHDVFVPGLTESIRARFDPVCYEMIPFVQNHERLMLICNYAQGGEMETRFYELVDILREHLQKRACDGASFCVGVGLPERDIRRLRRTLETAERAVWCGVLRGRNQIFFYGKLRFNATDSSDVLTPTLLNELKSSAELFNGDGFARAVHSAFAPVTVNTDPAVIIDICQAAIDAVVTACRKSGYGADEREAPKKIADRLNRETTLAGTISDLTNWACEYFDRCRQERKNSRPIRVAKEYIEKHYMRTLTLEHIARQVHLNASYFSMIFKKETGQNFSDYLTAYRVEVAKRLLRETEMNISAICEAVGYADSKYFSRVFTKLVGIKPSAYRTLHG